MCLFRVGKPLRIAVVVLAKTQLWHVTDGKVSALLRGSGWVSKQLCHPKGQSFGKPFADGQSPTTIQTVYFAHVVLSLQMLLL